MNETVTIKEGGLTRRLAPIDKLKVNTTDNKDSMWVPTENGNTGVLHASENGIYIASEDGYEAYSEVIVRVTKDSFDGDTSFDDWDYETPDMDLENWDPETIEEFENDPEAFDDIFNNEDEWKDIDKPIDIKMDNPKIKDTKISGIDPVTGNEMEVGLDEDGYLTESTLPSSIKIVVPPDKHQYVDGQPILFRGMVVKAYTADGELWTDETHPDGIIPHSELTFPVTTASNAQSKEWKGDGINAIEIAPYTIKNTTKRGDGTYNKAYISDTPFGVRPGYGEVYLGGYYRRSTATLLLTMYQGYLYCLRIKGDNPEVDAYYYLGNDYAEYDLAGATSARSQTDRFRNTTWGEWAINIPESTKDPSHIGIDDLQPIGQTVPVQYIRSDGEVLEDSFTIEVLPDPDGAHPTRTDAIEYNGAYYQADPNLNAEAHYASGTVWVQGKGAIYNTRDAVALGLLKPVED